MDEHFPIVELPKSAWPSLLAEMKDPPKRLFVRGTLPDPAIYRYLCVVGSRKHTPQSQDACERLIAGLAGHAVVVVSGLALGIDAVAHRAALACGLPTVAFPGYGLADTDIYPQSHLSLAREILERGGALMSEEPEIGARGEWHFPRRNRIMAGISTATLIVAAGQKSGTLITADLALSYDRAVLVVPGPIFSPHHEGSNELLKDGAQMVTSPADILDALGLASTQQIALPLPELSETERRVLETLRSALSIDDITEQTELAPNAVSVAVSMLEMKRVVTCRGGKVERIR